MTAQKELRAAMKADDLPRIQNALDRIARQYFESSMRRIYGAHPPKVKEG